MQGHSQPNHISKQTPTLQRGTLSVFIIFLDVVVILSMMSCRRYHRHRWYSIGTTIISAQWVKPSAKMTGTTRRVVSISHCQRWFSWVEGPSCHISETVPSTPGRNWYKPYPMLIFLKAPVKPLSNVILWRFAPGWPPFWSNPASGAWWFILRTRAWFWELSSRQAMAWCYGSVLTNGSHETWRGSCGPTFQWPWAPPGHCFYCACRKTARISLQLECCCVVFCLQPRWPYFGWEDCLKTLTVQRWWPTFSLRFGQQASRFA